MSKDMDKNNASEQLGTQTYRIQQQFNFVIEIDKLKQIIRQTPLIDQSRKENDAEHSWHLAVMAIVLLEYAEQPVNLSRVIQMLLIHDMVEIYAGDTWFFDDVAAEDKAEREKLAADRLFGFLPPNQEILFRGLWDEFEEQQTNEAQFSAVLDHLQPMIHNYYTRGGTWKYPGVTFEKVVARKKRIMQRGSSKLWEFAESLLEDAVEQGFLQRE